MSLPALAARLLPASTPTTVKTAEALIDSLISAFASSKYVDNTTRAGSAQAWTWTKFTDGQTFGAWAKSPSIPGKLDFRIVIVIPAAGLTQPGTFKRCAAYLEPWVADRIWVGIAKSSGDLVSAASWSAANPFGTGAFSGYWPLGTTGVSSNAVYNASYWRVLETQETTWLALVPNSGSAAFGMCAGALFDPETEDAADSESDKRVYGMWTSVGYTMPPGLWGADNSEGDLFEHVNNDGYQHCGSFLPGTDVVTPTVRCANSNSFLFSSPTTMVTRTGKYPRLNQYAVTVPNGAVGRNGWCGRIREVSLMRNMNLGQALVNGGTTVGYSFAYHPALPGQPALLQY